MNTNAVITRLNLKDLERRQKQLQQEQETEVLRSEALSLLVDRIKRLKSELVNLTEGMR